MRKEEITKDMVEALKILRLRARGGYVSSYQANTAFVLLDDAGAFDVIDEAAGRRVPTDEELRESIRNQLIFGD